jgi:hypothetical protein
MAKAPTLSDAVRLGHKKGRMALKRIKSAFFSDEGKVDRTGDDVRPKFLRQSVEKGKTTEKTLIKQGDRPRVNRRLQELDKELEQQSKSSQRKAKAAKKKKKKD